MNDSVVVYRSFVEASKMMQPDEFKEYWMALFAYALEDQEPEDIKSTLAEALLIMAIPQIDANKTRRNNGAKGGAPKGNQNAKKQPKQPMVELENNQGLSEEQPNVNVNVNVNANVNDNEKEIKKKKRTQESKHCYGEYKHVRLTDTEYERLGSDFGEEKRSAIIKRLDEYIQEKPGYSSKDHNLAIRRWVVKAVEEDEQKGAGVPRKPNTTFHGFDIKHDYNYDEMEKQLLKGD